MLDLGPEVFGLIGLTTAAAVVLNSAKREDSHQWEQGRKTKLQTAGSMWSIGDSGGKPVAPSVVYRLRSEVVGGEGTFLAQAVSESLSETYCCLW